MKELIIPFRWALLVFFTLGITSGIGAIQHGNNPSMSFNMSLVALILMIATLGTDK